MAWEGGRPVSFLPHKVKESRWSFVVDRRAMAIRRFAGGEYRFKGPVVRQSVSICSRALRAINRMPAFWAPLFFIPFAPYFIALQLGFTLLAGIGVGVYALTVMVMMTLLARRQMRWACEYPYAPILNCQNVLSTCHSTVKQRIRPFILLNHRMSELVYNLGDFAVYVPGTSLQREEMSAYVATVQRALHEAMAEVRRHGSIDSIKELVRLVAVLQERLIQGRWQGLLDESDIPTGDFPLLRRSPARHRDTWLVLAGGVLATGVAGSAIALGVPEVAALLGAMTFLAAPALFWGSQRLSVSPFSVFQGLQSGLNQGTSNQQPPPGPPSLP